MNQGFDMFSFMSSIFPLFFILVFGIIIFTIIKGIAQWSHNNRQPVLTVDAKVISKRTSVRGGGETRARSIYFVTFEVESGDRMELQVNGQEFGQLAEGDTGDLQFQGTRYLGFTRKKVNAF
ncbi:DUF2500 domain-containing protein [Bacillus carboniphilus]